MQKSLAHPQPQSYNTDNQKRKRRSPSLSAQSVGKGWGAFLTTEHTTHTPSEHTETTLSKSAQEKVDWSRKG